MAILEVVPNYRPHPKQILLHNAPVGFNEISVNLYGGSRGGGKSAGILADAFMFANTYPGAKCCILRESLDAVKQSFLDKLPTLFPQEVKGYKLYEWREKSSSWYPSRSIVFPNGSYITLQRVANYQEAKAKQGWEFHYLAIDEVTKQDEATVTYLLSCVRSVEVRNKYTGKPFNIPTKVVFGCNPGGPGHKWVKRKFIDTTVVTKDPVTNAPLITKDYTTFVQHPVKKDVKIRTNIRFIPASYLDNPYLSDAYVANLMAQPEHLRKMDMEGNWDVVAGKMFEFHPDQLLDVGVVKSIVGDEKSPIDIYISVDWGYKPSFHSAHWYAVLRDQRVICFKELYGQELIFEEFVEEISRRSEGLHITATCLPHDLFRHGDNYRDNTGKIIGETKSDVFDHYGLNPISVMSGKGKVGLRYDKIHSATHLKCDDGVYKFRISKGCPELINEFDQAVHYEFDPTKIDPKCPDHAIDDFGLFLIMYSDDICPIGHDTLIRDNRSRLQRLLDEEEEYLDSLAEEEVISIANGFDLW